MSGGLITRWVVSGVSLPVTRPMGRGLLVGSPSARTQPASILGRLGGTFLEMDDPYSAMAELAAQPQNYASLILSLTSLFGPELEMIAAVKRHYPQIEIWLARSEGMNSVVDEAMRLGADGILNEDGPHRLSAPPMQAAPAPQNIQPAAPAPIAPPPAAPMRPEILDDRPPPEPILTAEELRALLDDQPPGCPA